MKKKNKKTPTTKKNGKSLALWIGLLLVAVAIGSALYFNHQQPVEKEPDKVDNYTVFKTGSGVQVDFTDKTKQIHAVIDSVLQKKKSNILDIKEEKKVVKRKNVEGNFVWTTRTIPVTIEKSEFDGLMAELEKNLNKIDVKILKTEESKYNEEEAMRIDIGISDKVDDDDVTITSDRLYVLFRSNTIDKKTKKTEAKAKLALIIDDFGYTKEGITAYASIHRPLTFAVLPNHPYSIEAAETGYKNGQQILLHLPMEALSAAAKVEVQTIDVDMTDNTIKAMVNELTNEIPHIIGVNNHQGSKATADTRVMKIVLNELATQGLFYIDSRTNQNSVGYSMAQSMGIKSGENVLFLDNKNDIAAIKEQIRKVAKIALNRGQVISIGHARKNTAAAIKEMIPELEDMGVELVFASEILE